MSTHAQDDLLAGLDAKDATFRRVFDTASESDAVVCPLEPAAQWLVDNFYLIDAQLREARSDLSATRQPRLR